MNLLDLAGAALAEFEGAAGATKPDHGANCCGAPDAKPGRHWSIHFLDREPQEVIFSADLAFAEVLELYPAAIAAVPWSEPAEPEPEPDPFPALPTCHQCLNLGLAGRDGFRRCLAALRGELPRVGTRPYSPQVSAGKRCEGYRPKPGEPDQRSGRERWPWLSEAPSTRKETA